MPGERAPVAIFSKPSMEEALKLIQGSLAKGMGLLVVGCCKVDYEGRASSSLDFGERMILIKEDGAVLVHRPVGYEPVNWQPPKCLFQTDLTAEGLKIRSIRLKPKEIVSMVFSEIFLLVILNLVDKGRFYLYASEEDMRKAIILKPSLIEAGFKPIAYERMVEPGFIDVYGCDGEGRLVIIEIKRDKAGKEAVFQLLRYINPLRKANERVRGIIVAPGLGRGVKMLLKTFNLEFKKLNPYTCSKVLRESRARGVMDFLKPL